jgi:hypothetical protein
MNIDQDHAMQYSKCCGAARPKMHGFFERLLNVKDSALDAIMARAGVKTP